MSLSFFDRLDEWCESVYDSINRIAWLRFSLIFFLSVWIFSFGLSTIPPLDRDEPRFMQASKQMLETGNFIDIRLQEEHRYKKPIGIYWLQSASTAILHQSDLTKTTGYRIPSVLGGIVTVFMTYFLTRRLWGKKPALIAGLLAPLPILMTVEAHLGKTDSVLLASITASLYCLSTLWMGYYKPKTYFKEKHFWLFWLSMAVGILVKGINLPFILLIIIGLSIVKRDISWLKPLQPLKGIGILLLCVLPWFLAIFLQSGTEFFAKSVGHDLIGKIKSVQESHSAPFGAFFLSHFITFFPLSLLTPFVFFWTWKRRSNHAIQFCLAAIVPFWFLLELMPTKLPHYILPILPSVVTLCSAFLWSFTQEFTGDKKYRFFRYTIAPFGLCCFIVGFGLSFAAMYYGTFKVHHIMLMMIYSICVLIIGAAATISLRHRLTFITLFLMTSLGCLIYPVVYGFMMPRLDEIWISSKIQAVFKQYKCPAENTVLSGFSEPSAVFLTGTKIKLLPDGSKARAFFDEKTDSCRLAIIEAKSLPAFTSSNNTPLEHEKIFAGININGGKRVIFEVFFRKAAAKIVPPKQEKTKND